MRLREVGRAEPLSHALSWEREGPDAERREGEGMVLVMLDPSAVLQNATTISAWLMHPLTFPLLRSGPLPLPRKGAGEGHLEVR